MKLTVESESPVAIAVEGFFPFVSASAQHLFVPPGAYRRAGP
jgi:hypothetical protein